MFTFSAPIPNHPMLKHVRILNLGVWYRSLSPADLALLVDDLIRSRLPRLIVAYRKSGDRDTRRIYMRMLFSLTICQQLPTLNDYSVLIKDGDLQPFLNKLFDFHLATMVAHDADDGRVIPDIVSPGVAEGCVAKHDCTILAGWNKARSAAASVVAHLPGAVAT
eukprot:TRINITY_DN1110_c0_g1_i1.p1 TRINITY_DN1110_c0_g1~~TRINITY_DN1110_c0_g1_i1.p1  ORF type:complete len:164 (+),score=20.69 TRINITY_DN1110_c0_g1_i1:898-1389(+)